MTEPLHPDHSSASVEYVLTLSCPDRPGIVRAVTGLLADLGGNITESQQFGDPETELFFMRVQFKTTSDEVTLRAAITTLCAEFKMTWNFDEVGRRMRTIILVSKEGHCLSDLLFRARDARLPIEIVAVIGNHPDLAALAEFHSIPFHHIPVNAETRREAEAKILDLATSHDVELLVLARYMQILSDGLCRQLEGRMINIHHSFLPSFKGARPYAQAHLRGVKIIGATAHYVTAELDEGPIIEQDIERVTHGDSVSELQAIGKDVERRTLARAVRWHAEHRVLLDGKRTVVFR